MNKPTPRARQLQKARRTYSNDSNLSSKREHYHDEDLFDDPTDHDMGETGDTFVELIADDDNLFDDDQTNPIIKYRSSTANQK